jgi:hypothetical protein
MLPIARSNPDNPSMTAAKANPVNLTLPVLSLKRVVDACFNIFNESVAGWTNPQPIAAPMACWQWTTSGWFFR